MNNTYLSLGTNLEDRLDNIHIAIEKLTTFAALKKISSIWETSPWGYTDQPYFLNCVVLCETELSAFELLNKISEIEIKMGRQKTSSCHSPLPEGCPEGTGCSFPSSCHCEPKAKQSRRFGPRIIDIDILFYNNEIVNTSTLTIPHPLLHKRKFVLLPLSEIAPAFIHPLLNKSIEELLKTSVSNEKCRVFVVR